MKPREEKNSSTQVPDPAEAIEKMIERSRQRSAALERLAKALSEKSKNQSGR